MVERIRTLLESRQLTPTQFADLIGVARPIVSHILSGRNKPSLEVVQRILAAMPELAMPWLLNGSGPMLATAGASGPEMVLTTIAPATPAPPSSAPARQPLEEVPVNEPGLPGQPSTNQYNAPLMRAAVASMSPVNNLGRKQSDKAATPAGRAGKPAPFKPAPTKPAAMPKRFIAASAAIAIPVNVGEPEAAPSDPPVEPSVSVPPTNAAATDLASPPLPATPIPASQAPSAAAAAPEASGSTTEGAMAQALFAGAEKPIRRIVIFYRDGSFADYQPE